MAGLWDPSQLPKKVPIVTSHDQPPSNCSPVLSAPKLKSGKPGNGTALTETEPEKWLHVPFHSFPFHYYSPSRSAAERLVAPLYQKLPGNGAGLICLQIHEPQMVETES